MTSTDGRWTLGIGDPTPAGWAIAAAYVLAASISAACAAKEAAGDRRRSFWLFTATLLGVLAINKQLDLQTLITQVGRDLALAQGWYERRQIAQTVFVAAIAVAASGALFLIYHRYGALGTEVKFASLGLVVLAAFIVIRATSFHHVDRLLFHGAFGSTTNRLLELAGIACVAASAIYRWQRLRRDAQGDR